MSDYELLELHNHKEFEIECCHVLNTEWQRSNTARLHSLQKSSPELPTSLIYLKPCENGSKCLVGYAKICRVLTDEHACWIESVIIKPEFRNCGLGRRLMEAVENYAKQKGFKTSYLVTDDKEGFYRKLGYVNSDPVCSVEGKWVDGSLNKLKGLFHVQENTGVKNIKPNTPHNNAQIAPCTGNIAPPPPPPPPNTTINLKTTNLDPNKNSIYLKKNLL